MCLRFRDRSEKQSEALCGRSGDGDKGGDSGGDDNGDSGTVAVDRRAASEGGGSAGSSDSGTASVGDGTRASAGFVDRRSKVGGFGVHRGGASAVCKETARDGRAYGCGGVGVALRTAHRRGCWERKGAGHNARRCGRRSGPVGVVGRCKHVADNVGGSEVRTWPHSRCLGKKKWGGDSRSDRAERGHIGEGGQLVRGLSVR